jgi:hypothetical protein
VYVAGFQAAVELWQVSHCADVVMWLSGLASAFWATKLPLWQALQRPVATGPVVKAWLIAAGAVVSNCAPIFASIAVANAKNPVVEVEKA